MLHNQGDSGQGTLPSRRPRVWGASFPQSCDDPCNRLPGVNGRQRFAFRVCHSQGCTSVMESQLAKGKLAPHGLPTNRHGALGLLPHQTLAYNRDSEQQIQTFRGQQGLALFLHLERKSADTPSRCGMREETLPVLSYLVGAGYDGWCSGSLIISKRVKSREDTAGYIP